MFRISKRVNIRNVLVLSTMAASLCSCATQPPLNVQTASGSPEGLFRNSTVAKVQTLLAEHCLNKGQTVDEVSAMQLTCGSQFAYGMQNMQALLYVGGDDNAQVQMKVRYTLLQRDTDVRVVVTCWLQNHSRFGQEIKRSYMDNNVQNSAHAMFIAMGGE